MRNARVAQLVLVFVLLHVAAPVVRAIQPAGAEFQVNSHTDNAQLQPAVAGRAGFVVVWRSDEHDGDVYGVFGRRYDAAGMAQAVEFQIPSYTTSWQERAAVAMDDQIDRELARRPFHGPSMFGVATANRGEVRGSVVGDFVGREGAWTFASRWSDRPACPCSGGREDEA